MNLLRWHRESGSPAVRFVDYGRAVDQVELRILCQLQVTSHLTISAILLFTSRLGIVVQVPLGSLLVAHLEPSCMLIPIGAAGERFLIELPNRCLSSVARRRYFRLLARPIDG